MSSTGNAIEPLRELLDAVTSRLAALEAHCGITPAAATAVRSPRPGPKKSVSISGLEKTPSSRHLSGNCK